LPVYFAYAGKDSPPAKRGLVFSATTTTLGIIAGALLAGTGPDTADASETSHFAELDYFLPMPTSQAMDPSSLKTASHHYHFTLTTKNTSGWMERFPMGLILRQLLFMK